MGGRSDRSTFEPSLIVEIRGYSFMLCILHDYQSIYIYLPIFSMSIELAQIGLVSIHVMRFRLNIQHPPQTIPSHVFSEVYSPSFRKS